MHTLSYNKTCVCLFYFGDVITKENLEEKKFKKTFKQIFRVIGKMEEHKYMPPKFSETLSYLATTLKQTSKKKDKTSQLHHDDKENSSCSSNTLPLTLRSYNVSKPGDSIDLTLLRQKVKIPTPNSKRPVSAASRPPSVLKNKIPFTILGNSSNNSNNNNFKNSFLNTPNAQPARPVLDSLGEEGSLTTDRVPSVRYRSDSQSKKSLTPKEGVQRMSSHVRVIEKIRAKCSSSFSQRSADTQSDSITAPTIINDGCDEPEAEPTKFTAYKPPILRIETRKQLNNQIREQKLYTATTKAIGDCKWISEDLQAYKLSSISDSISLQQHTAQSNSLTIEPNPIGSLEWEPKMSTIAPQIHTETPSIRKSQQSNGSHYRIASLQLQQSTDSSLPIKSKVLEGIVEVI